MLHIILALSGEVPRYLMLPVVTCDHQNPCPLETQKRTRASRRSVLRSRNTAESAMLSTARSKGLERAIASAPSASIPSFLLPAFPSVSARSFSCSSPRASQIGRAPISIPPEVTLTVLPPRARKNGWAPLGNRPTVKVEGPLGILLCHTGPAKGGFNLLTRFAAEYRRNVNDHSFIYTAGA